MPSYPTFVRSSGDCETATQRGSRRSKTPSEKSVGGSVFVFFRGIGGGSFMLEGTTATTPAAAIVVFDIVVSHCDVKM
jgi:hypothetical protein